MSLYEGIKMTLEELLRVHWCGLVKVINEELQTESVVDATTCIYSNLCDEELCKYVKKVKICNVKSIEGTKIIKLSFLEVTI